MEFHAKSLTLLGTAIAGALVAGVLVAGCGAQGGDDNPSGKADSYYTSCDHGNRIYEYNEGIAVVPHDPTC